MADPFHCRGQASIPGDDDLYGGTVLFDLLEEVESLTIWKFLIERGEVDPPGVE
jgi:hypothetical protein